MKLTKLFLGLLMVMCLMFAVGCSDDKDKGKGIDPASMNGTWTGDFAPWNDAMEDFDWSNEVEVTAVVSGANKVVFSGGVTGEGKISKLKEGSAEFDGMKFNYLIGEFEIDGKKGEIWYAKSSGISFLDIEVEGWGWFESFK